jgi:hypothetical protein
MYQAASELDMNQRQANEKLQRIIDMADGQEIDMTKVERMAYKNKLEFLDKKPPPTGGFRTGLDQYKIDL